MGATLRGGNEIHVGLGNHFTALRQPLYGPVHRLGFPFKMRPEGRLRYHGEIDSGIRQIIGDAILVVPLGFFFLFLVGESDLQAGTQDRLSAQRVTQLGHGEIGRVKILRVRLEADPRAGIALATATRDLQISGLVTAGERHSVHIPVSANRDLQQF